MDVDNSFTLPRTRTLCLSWCYQTASHRPRQQHARRHHDKVPLRSLPGLPVWRLWECVMHVQGERFRDQRHLWDLQSSEPESDWLGGKRDLWITLLVPLWSLQVSVNLIAAKESDPARQKNTLFSIPFSLNPTGHLCGVSLLNRRLCQPGYLRIDPSPVCISSAALWASSIQCRKSH